MFVSHDLDEAFHIGNRIAIMEGGRIVQIGTPDEILRNPSDAYVRAFFKGVDVNKYLVAKDVASVDETLVIRPGTDAQADMRGAIARLVRRVAPRLQVLAHSEIPETHTIRIGPILRGAA